MRVIDHNAISQYTGLCMVVPFVTQKRATLNLDRSHPALALFDGFRGQTTDAVLKF